MELIVCNNNEIGINSYILKVDNRVVVIDPNDYEEIVHTIGECSLDYIFLTHEHFDHIMAVDKLRDTYKAKVIAQKFASEHIQFASKNLSKFSNIILDFMNKTISSPIKEFVVKEADITYEDFYELSWEGYDFLFTHTPGHTKGSSCILVNNCLFSGDSLFECCETDTKGVGTSRKEYEQITISFFKSLENTITVYAGHYHSFILEDKLKAREKAIQIFKSRPKYTNLFLNYNDFLNILDNSNFFVRNDSIFIMKKYFGFYKFYYFVNDYKNLNNLNDFFGLYKQPVIIEIISCREIDEGIYTKIGFKPYKIYSRYRTDKKNKNFDIVKIANIEDMEDISTLINETFDPLGDYIPSNDELIELILKKEVFIIKVDNKLAGVSIYEKRHKNYYFRLSCVHPDHRPGLIGYMLASTSPKDGNIYSAWVDDKNLEAIKLNTLLGYKIDGTKNYIFIKNKETI
ncbi:MBL fold metallo-hydrolase [Aliarcobacter butzleri]|uniref:MBL fold metallo-hydrolase n=1 Tax=Aliarcobacter butzleri TaxID=28197 RepID=UPI0021B414CD|nr:MBL fold metallo-hydrolase [Aliarcobacter butzleri]MCT7582043.1 MBL fold metallo-hydrolase [Aliarcobacter butzleri]